MKSKFAIIAIGAMLAYCSSVTANTTDTDVGIHGNNYYNTSADFVISEGIAMEVNGEFNWQEFMPADLPVIYFVPDAKNLVHDNYSMHYKNSRKLQVFDRCLFDLK